MRERNEEKLIVIGIKDSWRHKYLKERIKKKLFEEKRKEKKIPRFQWGHYPPLAQLGLAGQMNEIPTFNKSKTQTLRLGKVIETESIVGVEKEATTTMVCHC